MNTEPTISVIIPAYNAANHIQRSIESTLNQTYAPLEIIVIDDGSTDETAKIIAGYPEPVKLLRQANGGPASARNHGVREARGEWIALLDADDSWFPHKLERQLPYTQQDAVGIIHCRHESNSQFSRPQGEITFETLWERNDIGNSSVLVRRSAFEAVGGFDENRELICVEDYNLWLRMTAAGWKVATSEEPLLRYTPAPGNLSSQTTRFAKAELANVKALEKYIALNPKRIRRKCIAIYDIYGRELFHQRNLREARQMFFCSLKNCPSALRLVRWLSTFLPSIILDAHRSRRRESVP